MDCDNYQKKHVTKNGVLISSFWINSFTGVRVTDENLIAYLEEQACIDPVTPPVTVDKVIKTEVSTQSLVNAQLLTIPIHDYVQMAFVLQAGSIEISTDGVNFTSTLTSNGVVYSFSFGNGVNVLDNQLVIRSLDDATVVQFVGDYYG